MFKTTPGFSQRLIRLWPKSRLIFPKESFGLTKHVCPVCRQGIEGRSNYAKYLYKLDLMHISFYDENELINLYLEI